MNAIGRFGPRLGCADGAATDDILRQNVLPGDRV